MGAEVAACPHHEDEDVEEPAAIEQGHAKGWRKGQAAATISAIAIPSDERRSGR